MEFAIIFDFLSPNLTIKAFAGRLVNKQAIEKSPVERLTVDIFILYTSLALSANGASGDDKKPVKTSATAYKNETHIL